MYFPGGSTWLGLLWCSVTSPETLDQLSCCWYLSVVMLLSLFLLNLQSKSWSQNTLQHNTFVCAIYPSFNFAKHFTAGRAKNEMAKTEKHEATILPVQVLGTVSPYPIVVTVICKVIKIVTLFCHLQCIQCQQPIIVSRAMILLKDGKI